MNVNETAQLLQVLKSTGATYFKSGDFEVTFGVVTGQLGSSPLQNHTISTFNHIPPNGQVAPIENVSPANPDATQKIKDLISTLSMPNEQLVDKIFPNGAGG